MVQQTRLKYAPRSPESYPRISRRSWISVFLWQKYPVLIYIFFTSTIMKVNDHVVHSLWHTHCLNVSAAYSNVNSRHLELSLVEQNKPRLEHVSSYRSQTLINTKPPEPVCHTGLHAPVITTCASACRQHGDCHIRRMHAWVAISVTDMTLQARSSGQPFSDTSLTQMPIDSWAIRMDRWVQRRPARRSWHAFLIRVGAKGTNAEMKQFHCTATVHEWMNRCVEGWRAAVDANKNLWFNAGKIWQQRQIAWQIVTKCHAVVKRAGVRRKRRRRHRDGRRKKKG